jgi:hypothetical protein
MMRDAKPLLHVVFGMSAAGSLRQALQQMDRDQRAIGLPDDLNFGPIGQGDVTLRTRWLEDQLGNEDWGEVVLMAEMFWAEAISPSIFPIVWVNRRNAAEYAGLLEFIWRIEDADFGVIDMTDVALTWRDGRLEPANNFGIVTPNQMVEARLRDWQATLRPSEIDAYRRTWKRLRTDNAPLRIVDATGLVSAPLSFFDELIMSCVTNEWQKCTRVVGEALGRESDGPFRNSDEFVLWARVRSLAQSGFLESRGDMSMMREGFVRSPLTSR